MFITNWILKTGFDFWERYCLLRQAVIALHLSVTSLTLQPRKLTSEWFLMRNASNKKRWLFMIVILMIGIEWSWRKNWSRTAMTIGHGCSANCEGFSLWKLFSLNFIKLVFMPLRSAALHIYTVFSRFGFQRVAALYAMLPFFTVPIKIFFYHVDVNGQRFTASGITCAGQKKFSALALYQFHRSAAAWTFFACPHVAGKSVGVRFFVCIGVYGCALIRCSAHL